MQCHVHACIMHNGTAVFLTSCEGLGGAPAGEGSAGRDDNAVVLVHTQKRDVGGA